MYLFLLLSSCLGREILFLPLIVASEEDAILDKEAPSASSHFFLSHFFPLGEDLTMPHLTGRFQ